jgi:hypothetical protein
VVDLLPSTRSDVSGKFVEIAAVSLNGVRGRIALSQRPQKVAYRLFDNSGFRW